MWNYIDKHIQSAVPFIDVLVSSDFHPCTSIIDHFFKLLNKLRCSYYRQGLLNVIVDIIKLTVSIHSS